MSVTIHFATGNAGKLRDFAAMAPVADWKLLPGFASLPSVEETGASFEQNARIKAEHYSRLFSGWVLADDSGLSVATLGGEPGVHSARYAGRHGDDDANNRLLLERLRGKVRDQRGAVFLCVLALARAGVTAAVFSGRASGWILDAPRGSLGFGYDPLFFSPAAGRSFGEMTPEQKASFSHRGAAIRELAKWLSAHESHFGGSTS